MCVVGSVEAKRAKVIAIYTLHSTLRKRGYENQVVKTSNPGARDLFNSTVNTLLSL